MAADQGAVGELEQEDHALRIGLGVIASSPASAKLHRARQRHILGIAMKPGDVVVLNSGGPKMTISSIDSAGAFCIWFSGDKRDQQVFPLETLKAYKPPTPSSIG